MAKTAVINVRTDPQTKAAAESLFNDLGISMSNAINILLKQAIRNHGISVNNLPTSAGALDITQMTTEELREEIRRSRKEIENGHYLSAEKFFARLGISADDCTSSTPSKII